MEDEGDDMAGEERPSIERARGWRVSRGEVAEGREEYRQGERKKKRCKRKKR
jgi:hypothetical protein